MLLPVKWLRDYIETKDEARILADGLTDSGSHVESIIGLNKGIENIIVGHILNIEKHPDEYLVEIAEEFNCSECAIRKALKKLNITRKKRQLHTKNNVRKK